MRSFGLLNTEYVPGQLQTLMDLGKLSSCELVNICWEASFLFGEWTHWLLVLWWEGTFLSRRQFCAMPIISLRSPPISAGLLSFSLSLSAGIENHSCLWFTLPILPSSTSKKPCGPQSPLKGGNVEFSRFMVGSCSTKLMVTLFLLLLEMSLKALLKKPYWAISLLLKKW